MRFGVREICDVVLRAKATQTLGSRKFYKNEPVLYFDSLKTSSLEGAATTVYAQGGRGNSRLIAWEGERTLTFTMEDALISPESFAILSGAGLIDVNDNAPIYVHTTSQIEVEKENTIVLPEGSEACWNRYNNSDPFYHISADIFVMSMKDGEIVAEPCVPAAVDADHRTITCYSHAGRIEKGDIVFVDYYVKRTGGAQVIEITPDKFGGSYYLEASTLFRRDGDSVDMPAEFIIPNCKVQSNFTFSMASTGDPSTFTFTLDAFPDYVKFDKTHKVLAAIQVISDENEDSEDTRQPCKPSAEVAISAQDPNVNLTYDNDSTQDAVKMTATGTNVDGTSYDTVLFGTDVLNGVDATQLDIVVPALSDNETYRIVQTNPALKYYKTDPDVKLVGSAWTKDKTYKGSDFGGEFKLAVLASEEKGNINVKVYKVDSGKEDLVQSVKITNKISFAI